MNADSELAPWRHATRAALLERRQSMRPWDHAARSRMVLAWLDAQALPREAVLGVYQAFRGEVDVLPFAERHRNAGGRIALPRVVAKGQPLEFRLWGPGDPMSLGVYDLPYPSQGAPVQPDVLLVPCVGFDDACFRLGYGGGFYDRTLEGAGVRPLTIGIAFASGRIPTIHPQPHDVALDRILTEVGVTGGPGSRLLR